MCSWNSIASLGFYLGMTDAGKLAERSSSHQGAGKMLESISGMASHFARKCSPGVADDLMEALARTDYSGLSARDGDRIELLIADLYKRLTMPPYNREDLPQFSVLDRHVREYLYRFSVSVRAALYGMGIRKEIISLENPTIRESVNEMRCLPCRAYGTMAAAGHHSRVSASLIQYMQSLIERPDTGIEPARQAQILDILDRISTYPGYYRQVDRERKAETAEMLVSVISSLRRTRRSDPRMADLQAILGMLLFNVFPSPAIVKYLTAHRPGSQNRFLQYEYNALLALNFLLMGKRAAAAVYCQRAYDAAPDTDLKAYARMLEGCLALENRDYRGAAATLENALETADGRGLRSLVGFYLGIVRYEEGEVGRALNCFRDARISAEGEADAMAACNNMGTCYMVTGDLGRALRSFEEAIAMGTYSGRASVKLNRSVASGNSGIVYMSMREYELAREQFAKALRTSRETGNARGVADQLMNIGLAYKAMGEYAAAAHHFLSGLNYAYTIDYIEGVLYAREQISQVLALQGKHDEEDGIYRDIARRHPGIRKLLTRR